MGFTVFSNKPRFSILYSYSLLDTLQKSHFLNVDRQVKNVPLVISHASTNQGRTTSLFFENSAQIGEEDLRLMTKENAIFSGLSLVTRSTIDKQV